MVNLPKASPGGEVARRSRGGSVSPFIRRIFQAFSQKGFVTRAAKSPLIRRQGTSRDCLFWHLRENGLSTGLREILAQMKFWKPKEYFVYFKVFKTHRCGKRSAEPEARHFGEGAPLKRERGELCIHPAVAPVSLFLRVYSAYVFTHGAAHQADRTLRPFARRRARTLRPLEVAIL